MDAIAVLMPLFNSCAKHYYVIEGDIKSYFDNVHHRKLMGILRRRIADGGILDLIWKFLKAGVMEGGLFARTESGVPQGESSRRCSPTSTSTSSTSGQRRGGTSTLTNGRGDAATVRATTCWSGTPTTSSWSATTTSKVRRGPQ